MKARIASPRSVPFARSVRKPGGPSPATSAGFPPSGTRRSQTSSGRFSSRASTASAAGTAWRIRPKSACSSSGGAANAMSKSPSGSAPSAISRVSETSKASASAARASTPVPKYVPAPNAIVCSSERAGRTMARTSGGGPVALPAEQLRQPVAGIDEGRDLRRLAGEEVGEGGGVDVVRAGDGAHRPLRIDEHGVRDAAHAVGGEDRLVGVERHDAGRSAAWRGRAAPSPRARR